MRAWIAIRPSSLSLDALSLSSSEALIAVLDHERVAAATPAAQRLGVRPGMRKKTAGAIAPQVEFLARDPERERQLLEAAALAMLQYTPEVVMADDDSLLLNVGPSLRAFGGPAALCRRVRASLRELDCQARLGMAPTAHGAWLLAARAASGPRRLLRQETLLRKLAGLPCSLLPQARKHLPWLEGIGCRTLEDLDRLPRAGLQRRCGVELPRALDLAFGREAERFSWVQAPLEFHTRLELLARIDHAPAVLAVARRLVQQMAGWLGARQASVARTTLVLEHERGRHARPPTRLEIALAEPGWEPDHLLRLMKERLDRLPLEAPVITVGLQADDIRPRAAPSATLFPEPGGTPADHDRLLELLAARLGTDCVQTAQPQADHRPEVANHWLPALGKPRHGEAPACAHPERPTWLLARPQPLAVREHRPWYGTPLRLTRGPERIESGWWDGAPISRDYFIADGDNQARYWIYREQSEGEWRWFLHGLFG